MAGMTAAITAIGGTASSRRIGTVLRIRPILLPRDETGKSSLTFPYLGSIRLINWGVLPVYIPFCPRGLYWQFLYDSVQQAIHCRP